MSPARRRRYGRHCSAGLMKFYGRDTTTYQCQLPGDSRSRDLLASASLKISSRAHTKLGSRPGRQPAFNRLSARSHARSTFVPSVGSVIANAKTNLPAVSSRKVLLLLIRYQRTLPITYKVPSGSPYNALTFGRIISDARLTNVRIESAKHSSLFARFVPETSGACSLRTCLGLQCVSRCRGPMWLIRRHPSSSRRSLPARGLVSPRSIPPELADRCSGYNPDLPARNSAGVRSSLAIV